MCAKNLLIKEKAQD